MTDGDRRIANMRLRAGGEVSPDSARHMGLFVVGRLGRPARHPGAAARLVDRGGAVGHDRRGLLPSTVLAGADAGPATPREAEPVAAVAVAGA